MVPPIESTGQLCPIIQTSNRNSDRISIKEFIEKAPKADLHTHITGSITHDFLLKQGREIDWNDANYPEFNKLQEISRHFRVDLNEVFKEPVS